MARSDLLLLDEPTNHLDLDAVLWLEDWLTRYPGTLLLITHDRDFLDGVAQVIVHVDARKLKTLHRQLLGLRARAGHAARAAAGDLREAAAADRAPAVVRRPLPREGDEGEAGAEPDQGASSGWSASPPRTSTARSSSPFAPVDDRRAPARAARRRDGALRRCAADLRAASTSRLLAGDRIGLLGPNGAGKSTLVKALAGTLPLAGGERHVAQNLVDRLLRAAPARAARSRGLAAPAPAAHRPAGARPGPARLPGRLRLPRRHGDAPVERFSGGEKARLVLAMIVRGKPQLLILDEPTNHLDIEMREALAEALQDVHGDAGRRRARSAPARRDHRRVLARAGRQGRAVRRRPRRLPRLGARGGPRPRFRGRACRAGRRAGRTGARRSARKRRPASAAPKRASRTSRGRRSSRRRSPRCPRRRPNSTRGSPRRRPTPEADKDRLKASIARQGELAWQLARLETRVARESWRRLETLDASGLTLVG